MARDETMDLSDIGLGELGERNDFYENQLEGLNKAARARGGVGANKEDEQAREFSQKQVQIESEIFGRLMDQHDSRSERAQDTDERKKAPIAESPDIWADDPDQFDWPGIDTPER